MKGCPFWYRRYYFTPSLLLPCRNKWKKDRNAGTSPAIEMPTKECVLPPLLLLLWFWLQRENLYPLWPLNFIFLYLSFSSSASSRRINRREKPTQECVPPLLLRLHVLFVYIPLSGRRIERRSYIQMYSIYCIKLNRHFIMTYNLSLEFLKDISIQFTYCQCM